MEETLKEKIKRAYDSDFIGDALFSSEEIEEIYSFVKEKLAAYNNSYGETLSSVYDSIFYIAVVNIIKGWNYDADGFLDYLFSRLGVPNNGKFYSYFTSVINRLSDRKKILFLSTAKKKYYSTVLAHSFAPMQISAQRTAVFVLDGLSNTLDRSVRFVTAV